LFLQIPGSGAQDRQKSSAPKNTKKLSFMKNYNKIENYALGTVGPRFKSWYPDVKEQRRRSF